MKIDIVVPSVGESVREGMVHRWLKQDGEQVQSDDVLVELETDKATVEVVAENNGVLNIIKQAGETVTIGEVLATIDDSAATQKTHKKTTAPEKTKPTSATKPDPKLSPAVRRIVTENKLDPTQIPGTGKDGRLLKQDVLTSGDSLPLSASQDSSPLSASQDSSPLSASQDSSPLSRSIPAEPKPTPATSQPISSIPHERRVPMSMLRRRIATRLVAAQNETAMLTTFNEVNLNVVMNCRQRYKETFKRKYDVNLGFMGFFCRACTQALQEFPELNAFVEGDDIIYHDYVNMGIAVSTPRGLVVPVIKNANTMALHEIETQIAAFATKARAGKINVDDMQGGTFTISNGGVFGSLLSTPILNPPQSGILGMHKINKRPIVDDNNQITIAPMMYLALSYDHRIADGKQAVGFLVQVKELLEDPTRFLLKV